MFQDQLELMARDLSRFSCFLCPIHEMKRICTLRIQRRSLLAIGLLVFSQCLFSQSLHLYMSNSVSICWLFFVCRKSAIRLGYMQRVQRQNHANPKRS